MQGISADIYFTDDLSRAPDISEVTVNLIDYFEGGTALPSSPTDTEGTINGIWQGFLEAPDNGFYNFYVEADPDARIELVLGGEQVELIVTDGVPQNRNAIELEAGRLYALKLTARRIKSG